MVTLIWLLTQRLVRLYEKAKSQDKKLYLYKDAYHTILEGEPEETIFQVLDDIILSRSAFHKRRHVIMNWAALFTRARRIPLALLYPLRLGIPDPTVENSIFYTTL